MPSVIVYGTAHTRAPGTVAPGIAFCQPASISDSRLIQRG